MQVITTTGAEQIYQQKLANADTLNVTVAFLMEQPQGDRFITTVSNKGHDLVFRNSELDVEKLVRRVNGIVIRGSRSK